MKDIIEIKNLISDWYNRDWKMLDGELWYRNDPNENYKKLTMSEFQDFLYYVRKYFG